MSAVSSSPLEAAASDLAQRLAQAKRFMVLTGAGVSTDSGIPDYRDEAGAWKRREPMKFQQFSRSLPARQRYWARSLVGFSLIDAAQPNPAHLALASLEQRLDLELLVTQNVDGLHQKAGSRAVLDLHGQLSLVECLSCRSELPRAEFQQRLASLNPAFGYEHFRTAPDGDADLSGADYGDFLVPPCELCGGVLKPGVVFFGESVPAARVERAMRALATCDALLVVGTSLMVFSGYRFARAAAERNIPIYIINRGKTRADPHAALKLEAPVSDVLPEVVEALA